MNRNSVEYKKECSDRAKKLWENPEYRARLSCAHKGKKQADETKRKLSEANKGHVPWMKGKTHSAESRTKMSEALKGHSFTYKSRQKISEALKGRLFTEERRRNIGNALRGKKLPEAVRNKISIAHTGMKRSAEACLRMSEVAIGRVRSPETKRRMSIAKKAMFKDENYLKKMAQAWAIKPTKPEIKVLDLLNSLYPGQWKYTGDFSFTINGKCPDFVNCNGQKKIIELFGDYWHRGENPQDRINEFKPFGYDTLVIWERELKDMIAVREKINLFHHFLNEGGDEG